MRARHKVTQIGNRQVARDRDGVVHVAFWGRREDSFFGYYQLCTGAMLMQANKRSTYDKDGHITCIICASST